MNSVETRRAFRNANDSGRYRTPISADREHTDSISEGISEPILALITIEIETSIRVASRDARHN